MEELDSTFLSGSSFTNAQIAVLATAIRFSSFSSYTGDKLSEKTYREKALVFLQNADDND